MKKWLSLFAAVSISVLLGTTIIGVVRLASQPPRGNAIVLLPPPTPIPMQVHISGAVENPGVYALSPGDRVQDAVAAAGGFTAEAQDSGLNLAALLEDGARVQVPAKPQAESPAPTTGVQPKEEETTDQPPSPPAPEASTKLVNINTATQEELETLSGIGPATALKIITFRTENGPFGSIEEIQKVSGIGPVTFENIKDFIRVND